MSDEKDQRSTTANLRAPDYTGAGAWRAWRTRMAPIGKRWRPDHDANVATWLLHCPGAHVGWSFWWISLIHLRPIEGVRPATITTPGAGWEMMCLAQQPDRAPDPDDVDGTMAMLHPVDWVVQFGEVPDDARAELVAEAVIRAIMRGQVSPDSDFRRFWTETIPATAACVARGEHVSS